MADWRRIQLKDVIAHRKGTIRIEDRTKYKLCRVQVHRRGVVLRKEQYGYEIKTKKQQLCHTGDLIVAEMDAKYGGYGFISTELEGAIVSSHYYLYELDKSLITQGYLEALIATKYIQEQIEAKGSTNYSSIRAWEFLEYEIPLPDIHTQNQISNRFRICSGYKLQLQNELDTQSTYLTKLRQAILQEAIEGKLTADWRAQHPVQPGDPGLDASALLAQIQAEKEQLIAEKKIRKQKPLPPIEVDEMPFELPEGWVWCRLGDIAEGFTYGSSKKSQRNGKIPVLRMGNLKDSRINWNSLVYTSNRDEIEKYRIHKGDLLFNRTNSRELVGKTALFDSNESAIYAGYLVKFQMLGRNSPYYMNYLMNSDLHREWCREVRSDAIGQSNINATKLRGFRVPLPPLTEQQAIVERVDRLLALVDELEAQVAERKSQADGLMQAVLREAFGGG